MKNLLPLLAWKSAHKDSAASVANVGIAMTPRVDAPSVIVIDSKRGNVDVLKSMLVGIGATAVEVERAMDGAEAEDTIATYTMSTDAVDRPGDVISHGVDAWDLTEYRSNPVMLFGHDASSLPIGKALAVNAGKTLKGTFKFAPESTYAFGATVGRMVKGGFLPACSVGFMPLEMEVASDRTDQDAWFPALNFKRSKLLELSAVPIPANAEALVDAKGLPAGDAAAIREWAERCLASEGDRVVVLPRATVERMAKIGKRSSLVFDLRGKDITLAGMPPIEVSVEVTIGAESSGEGEPITEPDEMETKPMHTCPSCGYTGEPSEFKPAIEEGKTVCPHCGYVDDAASFLGATKKEYESIDFTPPDGVREECARGVEWYDEGKGGDGLVDETIAWAKKIAAGEPITPEKAKLMNAWLARHAVDLEAEGAEPGDDGYPSAGRVAWALWGGDPAVAWSAKLVAAMESEGQVEEDSSAALPIASKGWHPEFASADELRSFVDQVTKAAVASALTAHTGRLPD